MLKSNNKYLYVFCFVLIELVLSINVDAQNFKDPTIGISNRIYVQYTDSLVEAFCYRGEKKIKTRDDLFYYWYAAQDIKHTRGAYEGKILHGTYTMFYYNKDLLAKGNFKYGLKEGEWRNWHRGGEIKSKEKWRNGAIIGKAYYYNAKGKIQRERNIKHSSGNGYIKFYTENGILNSKKIYKNNLIEKEIVYQVNKKGKLIEVKPVKTKSVKSESKKAKKSSEKKSSSDQKKKVKKQKTPKIKVQKYRQIVPGGEGA